MKISYYPGCTLKTKAKNLEEAALASMEALGVEVRELDRWNCCGAVHSLTDDDLIHQVAPVRDLVRAKEHGTDTLVTLCSMCYNTLARANLMMKNDEVKRDTINRFMDEEIDYAGEVEVVHFMTFLKTHIGWDKIGQKIKKPLENMKLATYYGCTLQRPAEVGIEPMGRFEIMTQLLETLGAPVVDFPAADSCCGSYQVLGAPDSARRATEKILGTADRLEVDALVTSCPLCEFNLEKHQAELIRRETLSKAVPVFYFTQLLALALGLGPEVCRLELNDGSAAQFLKSRNYAVA